MTQSFAVAGALAVSAGLLCWLLTGLYRRTMIDDISVQDIAEAATVNRATFYDHYTDKFALLEALIAGGFHQMLAERSVHYDGTCPSAAGAIVLAACDYLTTVRASQGGCERRSNVEALEDAAMIAAIRRVLAVGMEKHTRIPAERRQGRGASGGCGISLNGTGAGVHGSAVLRQQQLCESCRLLLRLAEVLAFGSLA